MSTFFILILSGHALKTRLQDPANAVYFYNPVSVRDLARDIVAIADSWCKPEHSNGNACEFGGSMLRIALVFVQQCRGIRTVDSVRIQDEIIQTGLTMGGSGFGSKYNTRVVYVPVSKGDALDSPLTDVTFRFFDSCMVDFIEDHRHWKVD